MNLPRTAARRFAPRDLSGVVAPDLVLLGAAVALTTIGLLMIRGATSGPDGGWVTGAMARQAIYAVVGLIAFTALRRIDYRLFERTALWWYAGSIGALLLVLALGTAAHGARRWIDIGPITVQPSEFAKIATAMSLAAFAAHREPSRRAMAVTLVILAPPAALVLAEPDLGTTIVLCTVWLAAMAVWGISWRILGGLAGIGIGLLPLLFAIAVPDYQRERIAVFLDPGRDPLGSGFTARQVQIALANGGITGRGFGAPSALEGLAPRTADFAFAQTAEQIGLIGSLLVLGIFLLIAWRGIHAALHASDNFGRLLAIGVTAAVVLQAVLHVAVNIRLFPATGIPLPFISQGGSALVTAFAALGIVESVAAHGSIAQGWR